MNIWEMLGVGVLGILLLGLLVLSLVRFLGIVMIPQDSVGEFQILWTEQILPVISSKMRSSSRDGAALLR